eukprot:10050952-Alexandrium_andersonii.AAC.1
MPAKALQLGFRRRVGRATMADSPRGHVRTQSTKAHWGILRAASKQAPCYRKRVLFYAAAWGAAKRRSEPL